MKSYTQKKIDALILCGLGAFITVISLAFSGAQVIEHFRNNRTQPIEWIPMVMILAIDLICFGLGWVLYRRACRKEKMIGHCPTEDTSQEFRIVPPW